MIIKKTTQVGNPIIRKCAKKVLNPKSKKIKRIINNLVDSMIYHDLVGIAAPQIGISLRIFVSEIRKTKIRKNQDLKKDMHKLMMYINPEITQYSKKRVSGYEGCGSVGSASFMGKVSRSQSVTVKAFDNNGEPFQLKAMGLLARVIQHEIDHLNGVVFTDSADPKSYMSRNEYLKKFARK
jgi:peptide deformylase